MYILDNKAYKKIYQSKNSKGALGPFTRNQVFAYPIRIRVKYPGLSVLVPDQILFCLMRRHGDLGLDPAIKNSYIKH